LYSLRQTGQAESLFLSGILGQTEKVLSEREQDMPAFDLAEFERQMSVLQRTFSRPTEFLPTLKAVFERYGLPSHRTGNAVKGVPEPAYHVSELILRQIELALLPLVHENQGIVLRLADVLWKDRYYEVRMLGAYLVGKAPLEPSSAIVDFLKRSITATDELDMQVLLLARGSERLRREESAYWLETLEEWLHLPQEMDTRIGLRSLLSIVEDQSFENIPPVFRMLEPFLLDVSREQESVLRLLIAALAKRTPIETAYFLQEVIPYFENERSLSLVRSCLEYFEDENQLLVRDSLRLKMTAGRKDADD